MNEGEGKICLQNPETRYTKAPLFHRGAGICMFQVRTCVSSPCQQSGEGLVHAWDLSCFIYQEICHLAPAFTKAPSELQARRHSPLNRGVLCGRGREGAAPRCNFFTYLSEWHLSLYRGVPWGSQGYRYIGGLACFFFLLFFWCAETGESSASRLPKGMRSRWEMLLEEQGKEACRVSASPLILIMHAHASSGPSSSSNLLSQSLPPPKREA